MALKGTATIELTNADGSKQVIKHENMITNAVNDMCISQRGEMASILKIVNNNDSYAQALFGGLLLFEDTLDTDADNYFFPSTNIVGYASQDAYAGFDVARGSFNASEGGVQSDGSYKFVWDFSTSQANGTIKSLALCPNMMGKIGASDTIVDSDGENFYITNDITAPFGEYGRMLSDSGNTDDIANYNFNIVALIGDIAYAIETYNIEYNSSYSSMFILNNGGVIRLYKFKLGSTSISLADRVGMARYLGYVDVSLPSDFTDGLYSSGYSLSYCFDYSTGKLILFPCYRSSTLAVNSTLKYVEIDMKNNMETTVYTFTNNTAGEIPREGNTHNDEMKYNFYVCKDYIVSFAVVGSEKKMYVTKRSDNTQVVQVKYSNGNEFIVDTSSTYFAPVFLCGNVLVFRYYNSNTSENRIYILNLANGIIKKTNAKNLSEGNNLDIGNKVVFARTGAYLEYRITLNPFVLCTKNNLDSPVTKTASQTMKITYTLSEVTESGV